MFTRDPLTEYLGRLGAGEADGGGTGQNQDGEIAFCDVHSGCEHFAYQAMPLPRMRVLIQLSAI